MFKIEPNIEGLIRHIPVDRHYTDQKIHHPFDYHQHSELEFLYILEGTIHIQMLHGNYVLHPGDVMIFNSSERHEATVYKDCRYIRYECLQINLERLQRIQGLESDRFLKKLTNGKLLLRRHLSASVAKENGITAHLLRIIDLLADNRPLQELALNGEISMLLFDLIDRGLYHHSAPKADKHTEFVNKLYNYMEEHYAEDLTTESVAAHFNYNKSYFCRRFKEEFGTTFCKQLRHLRIYKAMTHPLFGQCSWEELAFMVGFRSYQYFYRAFKEQFRFNPGRYKQNHLAGNEPYFGHVVNTIAAKKGENPYF